MQPSIWVKVPMEEKQLLICFIHSKISFCVQGSVLRVSSILKVLWRTAAVRFPIALKASAPASPNQCGPCIVRPHSSSCPCIISIITAILPELWNGPHILYIHMLMLHCQKKRVMPCCSTIEAKSSKSTSKVVVKFVFTVLNLNIFTNKWQMDDAMFMVFLKTETNRQKCPIPAYVMCCQAKFTGQDCDCPKGQFPFRNIACIYHQQYFNEHFTSATRVQNKPYTILNVGITQPSKLTTSGAHLPATLQEQGLKHRSLLWQRCHSKNKSAGPSGGGRQERMSLALKSF